MYCLSRRNTLFLVAPLKTFTNDCVHHFVPPHRLLQQVHAAQAARDEAEEALESVRRDADARASTIRYVHALVRLDVFTYSAHAYFFA